jgi:NADH:ubiquinone oxidoreductase subunit 3 (subunit A)
VLLVPWAAHYQQLSCAVPLVDGGVCAPEHVSFYGFGAMLIFMVVLVAGFVYEWKKGAMQWD